MLQLSDCTLGLPVIVDEPNTKFYSFGHITGFSYDATPYDQVKSQNDEYNRIMVKVKTVSCEKFFYPDQLHRFTNEIERMTRVGITI